MARSSSHDSSPTELSTISEEPLCRESPLAAYDSWITPTALFYVRNHFSSVPELDASTWSLTVDGEVEQPLSLSYEEITKLPTRSLASTLECAGNSRSAMTPPAEGIPFGHGAVSTAEWTGVSLAAILERAVIKDTAREVVLEGADYGEEEENDVPIELGYVRGLPLEKALDPDILLAHRMNGDVLSTEHGWPLRAIVPGWYAMASVKWLVRIRVLDHPFDGFFQKLRYILIEEGGDIASSPPLTALRVKSLIVQPVAGERVPPGEYRVCGYAWSGHGDVAGVEVSTDWGKTWQAANLLEPHGRYAWRQWEFVWWPRTPGRTILMARATDSEGNTQPLSIPWNYRGYANNATFPVPVEVRSL
jgi:DMSO/TMAO reductase YedYZ molybdopterin-dependent catalytic subunit